MFENLDDYDFVPSGGSKLASLFDSFSVSDESNSSLTYSAPKQPKVKKDVDLTESTKSKSQTSVILAKVVTLWKLDHGDYKHLGKHGLAIIGSTDLNLFEVISYKEKNNVILRRKINSSYNLYNQKDCFSSFYDNENQNWLVKFENSNDQNLFCKEIKTQGGNIVDNVESSASENLSTSTKEHSLKPDIHPREGTSPKPEALPRLSQTLGKDAEEEQSDSSSSQKRANILSRMAKMGQQILPKDVIKNPSTDISDSELDDARNDHKTPPRKYKRAVPLEKYIPKEEKLPTHQNYSESPVISTQNLNHPVQFPQQNMIGSLHQGMVTPFPSNMMSPVVFNQPMPYDGFHQYIVSQNTELKMNLAQITSKLDSVLNLGIKNDIRTDDISLKSKIKTLELRSENLLTELETYERKYDELQEKCKHLEEKGSKSDENKSVIENLNKQIDRLKDDLETAEEKVFDYKELEANLEKYRNDILEHEKTIETQKLKLRDLEEFYEQNKDNTNLQETIDTLNDTVSNLQLKLKDFEEHFLVTEAEKQKRVEENEKNMNIFSDKIKEHMNVMYQSILASFEENKSYSFTHIKSQVAQNLKGTTFAIIKGFQDIYGSEDNTTCSNK